MKHDRRTEKLGNQLPLLYRGDHNVRQNLQTQQYDNNEQDKTRKKPRSEQQQGHTKNKQHQNHMNHQNHRFRMVVRKSNQGDLNQLYWYQIVILDSNVKKKKKKKK